jgi:hypothetical protein
VSVLLLTSSKIETKFEFSSSRPSELRRHIHTFLGCYLIFFPATSCLRQKSGKIQFLFTMVTMILPHLELKNFKKVHVFIVFLLTKTKKKLSKEASRNIYFEREN